MEDNKSKYERLTERGYHYDAIPLSLKHIRRLQELEDKIEDGLLVELPCPIGAPIWEIEFDNPDEDFSCSCDCQYYNGWYDSYDCEEGYDLSPSVVHFMNTGDKSHICSKFRPVLNKYSLSWNYWGYMKDLYNITWFTDEKAALAAHQKVMEAFDKEC